MKKTTVTALAALILLAAASGTAFAHKVNVFAYAEDGKVFADCYFSDGKKCVNSKIEVLDSAGDRLLEGETDANGAFSFKIPKADDLKIVLHASMGHQAEYIVKKSEVEAAYPGRKAGKKTPGNGKTSEAGAAPETGRGAVQPEKPVSCPDQEQLRRLVGEEVDARVKPLYKMAADIRQAQEKPRLGEIIGGIGYIVGLMGIYFYGKSKGR